VKIAQEIRKEMNQDLDQIRPDKTRIQTSTKGELRMDKRRIMVKVTMSAPISNAGMVFPQTR
jgi:hypothetical protein